MHIAANKNYGWRRTLLNFVEESLDVIKIGTDGAVCVKGDGGYGVVHQGEMGILCSTCHFNKRACEHVTRVIGAINEQQSDIPGFLIPLSRALCVETTQKKGDRAVLYWP